MHGRLNDAAQLGGGRRRHLRKNLSALGFIRLRFAGLRARAQAQRQSTPAAIAMLLATIVLMAVTTTPPAAAARQAHPAQPMEAVAPREAGKPIMAIVSIKTQQVRRRRLDLPRTGIDRHDWTRDASRRLRRSGEEQGSPLEPL